MSGFTRGLLIGVGVGLLVAPMRGEDMRRMLGERISTIRASLPENEQINQYVQQVTDRVSQTSSSLKDYAQQAASKVKETGSTLSDLAQQAGTTMKQTGQDVSDTTKQTLKSANTSKQ